MRKPQECQLRSRLQACRKTIGILARTSRIRTTASAFRCFRATYHTGHCQRRRRHGLSPTFRPIEVGQHDGGTEVCLLKTTHRPRQPSHPKIYRRRDFGSGQQVADFACRLDGCWSQDCKQLPLSSGTRLAEGSRRLGDRGIGAGRLSSFIGSSRGSSTAPPSDHGAWAAETRRAIAAGFPVAPQRFNVWVTCPDLRASNQSLI